MNSAAPGDSTPPNVSKLPPTTTPAKVPSFSVREHIELIWPSAEDRFVRMPFGSGVRIDEPLRLVISVWFLYSYKETPSKSPVIATRPSDDSLKSGIETASNDNAWAVGKRDIRVDRPAAAGPNNEENLIVSGMESDDGQQVVESPRQGGGWLSSEGQGFKNSGGR